ncbi:hypothetical protein SAMN02910275_00304 [Butyrivibrio sp. INlla18]|uniref:hypothetical protein n=1 Tax=Butyrivibrio sp. INlla18 TaxID=1520806 RepID=UPI000886E058|nr:hypothetical protein [Butyrivibrio sp. INlla18]SDA41879.1 hypothetical protein SAMN02910275_00304 [Butyrivibrio sp. INlla18]
MKGKHHVLLETNKVKYEFDIKRNITIIQGDSATGKTTLASLVSDNSRYGEAAGIRLQSDVPCVTYNGGDFWKQEFEAYQDTIIIIDEGNSFIFTKEFAKTIQNTSNYYVLITRKPLYYLPYSVSEIYGIRTSGKYHYPEKIYHEFYPLYFQEVDPDEKKGCKILVVEDKRAGYQFYTHSLDGINCISAEGNSNIIKKVMEYANASNEITVIADGAAFGAYVGELVSYRKQSDFAIYLPESFEWMVLKAGVVNFDNIEDVLSKPEEYIESKEYFSWERYFTSTLRNCTASDLIKSYSKDALKPYYFSGKNKEKILSVIPEKIREQL